MDADGSPTDRASVPPGWVQAGDRLALLRSRLGTEPWRAMYRRLCAAPASGPEENEHSEYHRISDIVVNAFRAAVEANDVFARRARQGVSELIADPRWATSMKGLTLYAWARCVARALDWCRRSPSWDDDFVCSAREAMRAMADFVYENGGTQQNRNPASNWQAIRFSSAGLCYLVLDPDRYAHRADVCWGRVLRYCRANMGDDAGSRGWNCEGLGYTYYPWPFIADFASGMEVVRGRQLGAEAPVVGWALWTVFAATVAVERRNGVYGLHPDFGDDNPHARGEGCYGLAFRYCLPELLPGIRWCYDRLKGDRGDATWDSARAGTIYSLLWYRDDIAEQDPLTIPGWRDGLLERGGNAMCTYRNRYEGCADQVAQFYVKARGNRGHHGPDALSFRLLGHAALLATGGGRYGHRDQKGVDRFWRSMNTLYPSPPDGAVDVNGNAGRIVGHSEEGGRSGGYVVAEIDCSNVGVRSHRRWFIADYSRRSGADAVYVVADTSDNGWYWQFCTVPAQRVQPGAQGCGFVCRTPEGATLCATALTCERPTVDIGERPRGTSAWCHGKQYTSNRFVTLRHSMPNHLVVMTVTGPGRDVPVPSFEGSWPGRAAVQVGGLRVAIDGLTVTAEAV